MKRMPYTRPTDHYDERIVEIDEQLCSLIKARKDLSLNNPGYPPFEKISDWAAKFGLYEDFLKSLFGQLRNEEFYRPRVEPSVFLKQVPVLKAVEKDGDMYTVTFIRQYDNASVIYLNVDYQPLGWEEHQPHRHHRFLELKMDGYDTRNNGGSGGQDHQTYQFVVVPPVPDDLANFRLEFVEYTSPLGDPTGFKVSFLDLFTKD